MAAVRTPRTSWIEQGLRALAAGGPDAVRVETLAQTLGVSKGGFYWHFQDRRALLEEMLDSWERTVIDEAIERVESGGGDARGRMGGLFGLASPSRGLVPAALASRDWARAGPAGGRRLPR